MHRQAAVAGLFYPADEKSVRNFFSANQVPCVKDDAKAVVVPHAGYIYSGKTAIHTLSHINIPDRVILAGPNHTGDGASVSVYPSGEWETPLGDVPVDVELAEELCADGVFTADTKAHISEHSLEVILPMLKFFNPNVKVLFMTMKYISFDMIQQAARRLSEKSDALFVASSDMNHFEDVQTTELKDKAAIDMMMAADAEGLYRLIPQKNITMCGIVPACTAMLYAGAKGKIEPVFVEHTHSGVVSGDQNRVVGYAGLYFK